MSAAPKLEDVQTLAGEKLAAAAYLVAKEVPVIVDDGMKWNEIEAALGADGKGTVVVVKPVTDGIWRDQSGKAWLADFEFLLQVSVNQTVNVTKKNANIYAMVTACITALCAATRHPGGEFFKLSKNQPMTLDQFDEGLWSYLLAFTKEGQIT